DAAAPLAARTGRRIVVSHGCGPGRLSQRDRTVAGASEPRRPKEYRTPAPHRIDAVGADDTPILARRRNDRADIELSKLTLAYLGRTRVVSGVKHRASAVAKRTCFVLRGSGKSPDSRDISSE